MAAERRADTSGAGSGSDDPAAQRGRDEAVPPTPLPSPPPLPDLTHAARDSRTPPPGPPPTPAPAPIANTPPPSGSRPQAFHTPRRRVGRRAGRCGRRPPPPPGPPQQPPSGGTKIPWIPMAAAAAVFVLVLGALGIWLLVKPDDSSIGQSARSSETTTTETSQRTTSRTPRTTTADGEPGLVRREAHGAAAAGLRRRRLRGRCIHRPPAPWRPSTAAPRHPTAARRMPGIRCSPTSGPRQGLRRLGRGELGMVTCPDSDAESPTTWHFTDTPDKVEGRIACGDYQRQPGRDVDQERRTCCSATRRARPRGSARLVAEVRLTQPERFRRAQSR